MTTSTEALRADTFAIVEVAYSALEPHPENPRPPITAASVADLLPLIDRHGQTQPGLVRRLPGTLEAGRPRFQIILGHRRAFTCSLLERPFRCVIEDLSDDEAVAILISDAHAHEDPDPMLEAKAVASLLARPGWKLEDVAAQLGHDVKWVARRANLRKLAPKIQKLRASPSTKVHLWPLAWLEDVAALSREAQDAIAESLTYVDSKPYLDRLLGEHTQLLSKAQWPLEDAQLLPKAGACTDCTKTSARTPGLFDEPEGDKGDLRRARCLDGICWRRKSDAHVGRELARAREQHGNVLVVRGAFDERAPYREVPESLKSEKILSYGEFQRMKKGDPKAVAALVFDGKEAGKTIFVKPVSSRPAKRIGTDSAMRPPKTASGAEKLAASRERIESRREAAFVDLVAARIRELPVPAPEVVRSLVAAYGARAPDGTFRGPAPDERADVVRRTETSPEAWGHELWPRVVTDLSDTLKRVGPGSLDLELRAARWLAEVLGLDRAALERDRG